jgi:hypothetical protein
MNKLTQEYEKEYAKMESDYEQLKLEKKFLEEQE